MLLYRHGGGLGAGPIPRAQSCKALKLLALGESPAEPDVRERLLCELEFFQSHLETEEQPYLLPGSSRPSAADISLYVLVERIVGTMGDVPLPCAAAGAAGRGRSAASGSCTRGCERRTQSCTRGSACEGLRDDRQRTTRCELIVSEMLYDERALRARL